MLSGGRDPTALKEAPILRAQGRLLAGEARPLPQNPPGKVSEYERPDSDHTTPAHAAQFIPRTSSTTRASVCPPVRGYGASRGERRMDALVHNPKTRKVEDVSAPSTDEEAFEMLRGDDIDPGAAFVAEYERLRTEEGMGVESRR